MVEFSFGFTRVSATPETTQHDVRMPVRLKGFPPLANGKRPVYVIEQQNEALYIRLQAATVAQFLQSNGVLPALPREPKTLGGALIETYQDFGVFLKDFSVRDEASRVRQRSIASMTYLLLHTFAHHVMHGIARFSGLDLGSLSEVIFPAYFCLPRPPAWHDGGSREYLIHVAGPERRVPALPRFAPRNALRLGNLV